MKKILIASAIALISSPALAQDHSQDKDHSKHEMHERADHDHEKHDHGDHPNNDPAAGEPALSDAPAKHVVITKTDEILTALDVGGEPIVVDILGVVCDFCAKAMNKTFSKRKEVAATFVDLDTKALSLVLAPGAVLDDETITKLVKKAGYRASAIRRDEIALNGGGNAIDPS